MDSLKQLLIKKITIVRWRVNFLVFLFLISSLVFGSYFLVKNIKRIFAFNDTINTWNINVGTSNTFTFDTNFVSVGSSGAQPINNVNKVVNSSFDVGTSSWSLAAVSGSSTPAGWVVVPGSSTYSTSDFLVMKYEAKCASTSDLTVGLTSPSNDHGSYTDNDFSNTANNCTSANNRQVVSVASGYPIGSITQLGSRDRCETILLGGNATHLINNNEWMTVARNAEAQASNWSLGAVGSGYLYAGHNDNQPDRALQASTNDTYRAAFTDVDGTIEALTTATKTDYGQPGDVGNQVRNFYLSSGDFVWDIAGNDWEWVDAQVLGKDRPIGNTTDYGWWEFTEITNYKTLGYDQYGPLNHSYNGGNGVGRIQSGGTEDDTTSYSFLRGGNWNFGSFAGAFSVLLNFTPDNPWDSSFNFRCASDPITISQAFSSGSPTLWGGSNLITVGPLTDAKLIQSINVGNIATYDFSAYVYDNTVDEIGSTITSSVAQLYYNGATILTTYSDAGYGWYKLSGSVTGENASRDFGLLIKAGKTVKVDNFTLAKAGVYSIYTTTAYTNSNITNWDSFTASVGTTNNATVTYQICADDGSACESGNTWKYWNGSSWASVSNSTIDTNNASVINDHISTFTVAAKKISVKAIMSFSGSDIPTISSFAVGLTTDTVSPGNISIISMKKNLSIGSTFVVNNWTNDSGPYFSWNQAADNDGGTGIKGYCLYLSNGDFNPNLRTETSSFLPGNTSLDSVHISSANTQCGNGSGFLVSTLNIDFSTTSYRGTNWLTTSSTPYYFYVKAVDIAGNIADDPNVSFYFRFDNTPPTNPSYISLPGDYISTKIATFLWASSGADGPKDEGQSGVAGLQYRIGVGGTWYGSNHSGTQAIDDLLVNNGNYTTQQNPDFTNITEGSNIVYLRTWDIAGNVTTSYLSSALKINTQSPSEPTNLTVTPSDSTTNSYAFTWEDPTSVTGQASNLTFCYSINALPTAISCTFTAAGVHSLTADAFATQPGINTLYLVARDEAGNLNYDNYESKTFTYSGSAPGIPRNVDVSDISIKATSNWKLTVSWDAPTSLGAGIANYKIYRSVTDNACSTDLSPFSIMGTTAGTSYSDVGLSQKSYYYCIKACDSANNCSAASTTVNKYPTGKYFTSASLTSGPTVSSITTKKAVITWSTDRNSDSKVSYGTGSNSYYTEEPSNSSQVTDHTINLNNLSPGTTYYYKLKWTDEDGNTGTSDEKSFTTASAPTVKDVSAKNIGLSSAIIQFTSNNASKIKIYYGTTTSFGGVKEISTSTTETTYTSELISLNDGVKYYYKINTFDSDNSEYEGTTLDFTTLPRPKISTVRLQQVTNTAQSTVLVSWNTNTEVSSIVTYWPSSDTSAVRDEVNVALTKGEHKIIVRGLLPNTDYVLQVKGRDKIGNEAVSEVQHFTTAEDTRPPEMAGLSVEGQTVPQVAGTAQESSAQLIISWNTDEPATSQVEFGEGTGSNYSQKTQEDEKLTLNHLVIISNLSPSRVYHLRALSKDKAQNLGQSVDTVTITPKSTDNALNLVISNLSEVFSFIGGINK